MLRLKDCRFLVTFWRWIKWWWRVFLWWY